MWLRWEWSPLCNACVHLLLSIEPVLHSVQVNHMLLFSFPSEPDGAGGHAGHCRRAADRLAIAQPAAGAVCVAPGSAGAAPRAQCLSAFVLLL